MKHALGQLARQEGIGAAERFGGGEQILADGVGIEGHDPAVAFFDPRREEWGSDISQFSVFVFSVQFTEN